MSGVGLILCQYMCQLKHVVSCTLALFVVRDVLAYLKFIFTPLVLKKRVSVTPEASLPYLQKPTCQCCPESLRYSPHFAPSLSKILFSNIIFQTVFYLDFFCVHFVLVSHYRPMHVFVMKSRHPKVKNFLAIFERRETEIKKIIFGKPSPRCDYC